MSFLISVVPSIISAISGLGAKYISAEADKAKFTAELATIDFKAWEAEVQAKSGIIEAEANSDSWLAKNWRPLTMLSFVGMMLNNFVLQPYALAFGAHVPTLPFPPEMWTLIQVGLGGYVGGRTVEKVADIVTRGK